jgi:GR25 family glycosyltransferase involved in LPS biosynthesis
VCTLSVIRKTETYVDYIENLGAPLYNLMPSDFEIFLINLASKKDRLDNFINVYNKTDLYGIKNFQRISAVNGRELKLDRYVSKTGLQDIEMIETRGYRIRHNQLTRGAVGCYLSHLNIYKIVRNNKIPYALIFEDDVKFKSYDLYRKMRILMAKIPDDWDMLLLGCACHVCTHNGEYRDVDHFFLLHAYVIKLSGAEKILNAIEFLPIRQQIDSELSALASKNIIKVYCSTTPLVWQDPKINKTTIQTPLKLSPNVNPYELLY